MKNILVFPKRGNPPKCPEGYESTGDPYIFQLKFISCKLRKIEISKCEFKKDIQVHRCLYKDQLTTPFNCLGCPLTHQEREFISIDSLNLKTVNTFDYFFNMAHME